MSEVVQNMGCVSGQ